MSNGEVLSSIPPCHLSEIRVPTIYLTVDYGINIWSIDLCELCDVNGIKRVVLWQYSV